MASSPISVPRNRGVSASPMSQRTLRNSFHEGQVTLPTSFPLTDIMNPSSVENNSSIFPSPQEYTTASCDVYNADQLIKCGWLYKRSKRKSWNKRWFVLRENQLIYYKDDREYKPKCIIPTEDIMAVAMLTDEHKPNHFAFFTPSKNYHLRADTISDAESWVSELKKTVDAASESNLSSSFKRIGILESAAQQQDVANSSSYRHSFIPSSDHLLRKGHHHTFSEGEPRTLITNNSDDIKTRLNFPKRHSINILDPSKLQKGVPGYNNGQYFPKEEASTSKLSKSFGSTTSPGSSRSEYLSSIMSTTDDVQSSLASTHTEEPIVDKTSIQNLPKTTTNIPDSSTQPEQTTTEVPVLASNEDTATNDPISTSPQNSSIINPTTNLNEQPVLEPSISPLDGNPQLNDEDEDKEIPLTHLDQENIIETGYLHKRKKRYNQWKKLWVVLTNQRILLFKNDKSKNPIKILDMPTIVDVMEMDAFSKRKQYCFQVITPEKRVQFAASTEEDLTKWIASIKYVMDIFHSN